ncbi:hypothetical protein [Phaeobacter italicus]|jgi:hypothetical protein|uniref:hypothetical protein n=1 Tax=Phaeobacter italicus TaxID=481446 RepID=UPI002FDD62BB
MTPEQIEQARVKLGLTVEQLGTMLDIETKRTMQKHLTSPECVSYKPPSARMVRLINAYLSGYRPDDWPKGENHD